MIDDLSYMTFHAVSLSSQLSPRCRQTPSSYLSNIYHHSC